MSNQKTIGQSGYQIKEFDAVGLDVTGLKKTVADSGVLESNASIVAGTVTVIDSTNSESIQYSVNTVSSTVTFTVVSAANSAFNGAKDNASTINVYYEDDQIKVQNLSGGDVDIVLKIYS